MQGQHKNRPKWGTVTDYGTYLLKGVSPWEYPNSQLLLWTSSLPQWKCPPYILLQNKIQHLKHWFSIRSLFFR